MSIRNFVSFGVGAMLIVLSSCTTQKKLTYLRELDAHAADTINAVYKSQSESVVQRGDELTISVSALDQEAVAPYNLPTVVYSSSNNKQIATTPSMLVYTVDEQGDITYPILGRIHVEGLLRSEVEQKIKGLLEVQVANPLVVVGIVNHSITILGEVNTPGRYSYNGSVTLLEALGMAHDLTAYGKRDNILITREVNGKLEFARLNLNSESIFMSPYYHLQPNDVIYVSPNQVKVINSRNVSLWLSMISTVASAATVIVTVINAAK